MDRLRLFRADLREEGSFDEVVKGCDGVFHVATSMEFSVPVEENIGMYNEFVTMNTSSAKFYYINRTYMHLHS